MQFNLLKTILNMHLSIDVNCVSFISIDMNLDIVFINAHWVNVFNREQLVIFCLFTNAFKVFIALIHLDCFCYLIGIK